MTNTTSKSIWEATVAKQDNEYWERHARRYDRAIKLFNRGLLAMAGAVADTVGNANDVLEIAAGAGLVTQVVGPPRKALCGNRQQSPDARSAAAPNERRIQH